MIQQILVLLKQGYDHLLENNPKPTTDDLEAEIINFASFVYLKESIDFSLDYLDQKRLSSLNNYDFEICDKIIDGASILFSEYYKPTYALNAKQAIRVNIQLADNYACFLKSYFISKHKIITSEKCYTFYSSRNSLWSNNGSKISDSPTQREVNYTFDFESNTFEVLINPYNSLVKGKIISNKDESFMLKLAGIKQITTGVSYDNTRQFTWIFKSTGLFEVIMNRFDKGDAVKYHQ